MQNYIKLSRSLLQWRLFNDVSTLRLWIYLLLKANYKNGVVCGVELLRGQCYVTVRHMAEELQMSQPTVIRSLSLLKKEACIVVRQTAVNRGTVVTIVNYDKYQCDSALEDAPLAQALAQPLARNLAHTNKEKKDKKEKNECMEPTAVDSRARTKQQIFVRPTVQEIQEYLDEKGYTDIDAEHFWNYYESKGWKVGRVGMKSWHSAIATWRKLNNDFGYRKNDSYATKTINAGGAAAAQTGAERDKDRDRLRGTFTSAKSAEDYETTF